MRTAAKTTPNWELLVRQMLDGVGSCVDSQLCKGMQCIMGRIRPIRLCKLTNAWLSPRRPYVRLMLVTVVVVVVVVVNNVGWAVQTAPTLMRYASVIIGQNKCWEFDQFQTPNLVLMQSPLFF